MDSKLKKDLERFKNLSFEEFKKLAKEDDLTSYQRIGFPNSYREGKEEEIFEDILAKLPTLNQLGSKTIDIGCGCSQIPSLLITHSEAKAQNLVMVDSQEMLDLLPSGKFEKSAHKFPDSDDFITKHKGTADTVIIYSVMHYAFTDKNFYRFLDSAACLLAPGGHLLVGDIPNISKRKRFFSSEAGVKYHQDFMKTLELPKVEHFVLEFDAIDDGVVFSLLQRYRNFGFESYLLPLKRTLPLQNRREDILIVRN